MAELDAEALQQFAVACGQAFAQSLNSNQRVTTNVRLSKFYGVPKKTGDPTLKEWLHEVDVYARQLGYDNTAKARTIVDHLAGAAREEILCFAVRERENLPTLLRILRESFQPPETVASLSAAFHARVQSDEENLTEFSRALMRLYGRMIEVATGDEAVALGNLRENALKEQFVRGAREPGIKRELRRIQLADAGQSFQAMREAVTLFFRDQEQAGRRGHRIREVECEMSVDAQVDQAARGDKLASHPLIKKILDSQEATDKKMAKLESEVGGKLDAILGRLADQGTGTGPAYRARGNRPWHKKGPKVPGPGATCHRCGSEEHWVRQCPQTSTENKSEN